MKHPVRNRAAPLIALLFICSGFGLFMLVNPPFQTAPIPTLHPDAAEIGLASQTGLRRSRGELQAALFHLTVQGEDRGWTADLHGQAGDLWRDMGDMSRALPHWEAAALISPQANNLRRLAAIYLQQGDWSRAYSRIVALLQLAPDDPWGLYYGGLILAPSDGLTAQDYLRRATDDELYHDNAQRVLFALGDDPTDVLVSSRVGAVLATMEEWALAENAFQTAAAVNYPFPEAAAYVALMRAQQYKDGSAWLEQAVTLASDNADVRYVEGLYWRVLEDNERSANALLTAIILDPTVPEYYAELGNTYRAMDNLGEAEYWLMTALSISDNDPLIQDALNRLRTEETFVLTPSDLFFSRFARAEQDDPAVLSANGWVLHILGQSAAGLDYVNRALAADPDNPRAQYDKARILLETGHEDEAVPLLQALAEGDSPFATTAERLLEGVN